MSLGDRFGCALLHDRTVWCWGRNDESQLGYPTTDLCQEDVGGGMTRAVACHAYPFQVVGLDHAVAVVTGAAFACALRDDGSVRCWGSNGAGQLGNGLTLPSPTPVPVHGLSGVTALAAGARHACALSGDTVSCWGANDRGQLGQASTTRQCTVGGETFGCEPLPVQVPAIDGVAGLTAGAKHTCARTADGLVACWGDNRYAQLGTGRASDAPSPTPSATLAGELPLNGITSVTAGANHTCALALDGRVWCWGRDDHGETGSAADHVVPPHCVQSCVPRPAEVPGLEHRDAAIPTDASGDDALVVGPSDDATTGFDGGSLDAALDAGTVDASTRRDAGRDVATRDGGVVDGAADDAAMGDASDDASLADAGREVESVSAPSMVPRGVSAGGTFACTVLDDGTARCWGDDSEDQLGDGRRTADPQPPVMVIASPGSAATNPLQGVASVASGAATSCALLGDGSLRCWGSNQSGALGNGSSGPQSGPVPVTW